MPVPLSAVAPKVSIIAPTFNHQDFIRPCLESVIGQTFTDWELIVIDDGSKDETFRVAQELEVQDSRIRALKNEQNLGTYGTEQKALDLAQGEFIAVLNTDDLWEPSKLDRQVEVLTERLRASFCYALGHQIDGQGRVQEGDVHADWPTAEEADYLPWLLHENRILASSVVFRRPGLRFETSCRYSGDWVALIEASLRGPGLCVSERLSHWRVHGSNAHLMSEARLIEEIRVRLSILRASEGWTLSAEARARRDKGLLDLIALLITAGAKSKAAGLLPQALKGTQKRAALKRLVGGLALPWNQAVRRLWPTSFEGFLQMDPRRLTAKVRGLELILFRPGQ